MSDTWKSACVLGLVAILAGFALSLARLQSKPAIPEARCLYVTQVGPNLYSADSVLTGYVVAGEAMCPKRPGVIVFDTLK